MNRGKSEKLAWIQKKSNVTTFVLPLLNIVMSTSGYKKREVGYGKIVEILTL